MIKKLLIALLAIVASLCLAFGIVACSGGEGNGDDANYEANANDTEETPGEQTSDEEQGVLVYTLINDDTEYEVTYSGTDATEIVIPEEYDGLPVTSIGDSAFLNCASLVSISIPGSVTSIGSNAFYGCTSLTSINIPNKVESIGRAAFSGCSSLQSITLPFVGGRAGATEASNTTLFGYIFGTSNYNGGTSTTQYYSNSLSVIYYIPTSLKNVTITGGDILYGAFYNCSNLTSIIIGNDVTSIGGSAFYNCEGLTQIYFNATACADMDMEDNAFEYAGQSGGGITVTIGANVTKIPAWLFCVYPDMEYGDIEDVEEALYIIGCAVFSVEFEDGSVCKSIGDGAFALLSLLTSITIPDSVTYIGFGAFAYCTSLTSVTIGSSVTSIGDYAFMGCTSLTSIDIPDSVTSIGWGAFYWCTSLTGVTIADSVTSIGDWAFAYCTSLTGITIPDGVISIGGSAFDHCTSLTGITIADSVTSIGDWAFFVCTSLESVYITDLTAWLNISFGGYYANPLSCAGNLYLNGKLVTELVVPDEVTTINSYAFYNCTSLTSVTIGDSVTSIGSSAFSGCSSLKGVYIIDITAWLKISFGNASANPLYYAGNLYLDGELVTELVIPNSVTSIGDYAFRNCTSLTSVTIGDGVTSIGDYAFDNCTSLTSVTIPDSITSIGQGAFSGCTSLTSITIPDSVTSIGSYAFYWCSSLTSITIPDSVTSIGSYAFSGCTALTGVTFENIEGWWCAGSSTATSGTSISGTALADPSTAATYLRSTYSSYYWRRV